MRVRTRKNILHNLPRHHLDVRAQVSTGARDLLVECSREVLDLVAVHLPDSVGTKDLGAICSLTLVDEWDEDLEVVARRAKGTSTARVVLGGDRVRKVLCSGKETRNEAQPFPYNHGRITRTACLKLAVGRVALVETDKPRPGIGGELKRNVLKLVWICGRNPSQLNVYFGVGLLENKTLTPRGSKMFALQ
jgi:hypothetical protein